MYQWAERVRTLTGGWGRAGLTGFVPSLAHIVGAAAHFLGHVEGELVLARVVEVAVAHTLPHVCHVEHIKQSVKGSREICRKWSPVQNIIPEHSSAGSHPCSCCLH